MIVSKAEASNRISSHEIFQRINESGIVNVLAINNDGIIIYANKAEYALTGCCPEEYIGKPITQFYTDKSAIQTIFNSIEHSEDFYNIESTLRCKDGSIKYVLLSIKHLQDDDGLIYTYLFIRDITTYKKNENLLSYLNTAAEVLAGARDTEDALNKISDLIVPKFANWFTIYVLKNGRLELTKLAHEDPEYVKIGLDYLKKYPFDLKTNHGTAMVLKTGKPNFIPVFTQELLMENIKNPEQLRTINTLGLNSVITVAMFNKETITGVITFISSVPGRSYDETDLRFAQNFANHIGLALENARLNEEAMEEIERRKKIEEELKRTQIQLKSALLSGLIGTWVRDLKKNIMYADESLYKIFELEYSPEGVDPYIFIDCIHPNDLLATEQKRKESIETGKDYEAEYRIVNKKGEVKWVFERGKTDYDANGEAISFAGVVGDITQRKNAEQALKQSEERFRLMAESMPQKIFVTDSNAKIIYLNPQWEDFTGYSVEKINELRLAYFIHPDDLEQNLAKWDKAIKTSTKFEYEHRFRGKDGCYYWHLTRALALRDAEGKSIWIGSVTDIDEQKKNEQKKDEFISIASHELKTPITSIRGYLQILLKKVENEDFESLKDLVTKTYRQAHKLSALVSGLLDVSKLQAGKMNYSFTEFYFSEIVDDAITDAQNNYSTHKIIVNGDSNFIICGDRHRLEQVISNLLSNAAKYSPEATEIVLTITTQNDVLTVSVRDFGVGIPEDKADFIFNRFFRVDDTSYKFSGLGIGLFISKEIIEKHQGELTFESKLGEGSTFKFSMPINLPPDE